MAGSRSRHRYNCNCCRREKRTYRFTLRHGSGHYKNGPKCTRCGSYEVLDYEAIYAKAQAKRKDKYCYCEFVYFPHLTTHKLCKFYPHEYPLSEEVVEELQELARAMEESNKTAKHVRTRNF